MSEKTAESALGKTLIVLRVILSHEKDGDEILRIKAAINEVLDCMKMCNKYGDYPYPTKMKPGTVIPGNSSRYEGGRWDGAKLKLVDCTYIYEGGELEIWTVEVIGGHEDGHTHHGVHVHTPKTIDIFS